MNYDILKRFRERIENQKIDDFEIDAAIAPIRSHLNAYFYNNEHVDRKTKIFGSFLRGTAVHGISHVDVLYFLPDDLRLHIASVGAASFDWMKNLIPKIFAGTSWTSTVEERSASFIIGNVKPWTIKLKPVFLFNEDLYLALSTSHVETHDFFKPFTADTKFKAINFDSHRNLEILAKTIRYWVYTNHVPMTGFLIDCLAMEFVSNSPYRRFPREYHDCLLRDFFHFLSQIEPNQISWPIIGTTDYVYRKGQFETEALRAYHLAERMIANSIIRQDVEAQHALTRLVGNGAT